MSRAKGYAKVDRLRRLLRRLPDDVTAGVREAIADGAQVIRDAAESAAPRDTGRMVGNIEARVARDGLSARIGFLGKTASRKAFYARFQEFGTVNMPARPFLFPALERNRAEVAGRIRAAVNKALTTAAADNTGGGDE